MADSQVASRTLARRAGDFPSFSEGAVAGDFPSLSEGAVADFPSPSGGG